MNFRTEKPVQYQNLFQEDFYSTNVEMYLLANDSECIKIFRQFSRRAFVHYILMLARMVNFFTSGYPLIAAS